MAITAHEFPITLDTSLKNNQLPFSINQGTTDTTLIITVSRLGQKLDISDGAKLEITAIYSCGRGSYIEDTDSTYHATTATISSGVITLPLSEGITTASGSTQLIIKITDSLQTYSTSLILEVLQNPAYSPQSIPDNLPTFNQVKQDIATNKANIQTNANSITDNTNAISNVDSKVDSAVVDIKSNDQDIGNNRKDIDLNSQTIQAHTTQIASKAEKDLSNVGEFSTANEGDMFYKKDNQLKVAPLSVNDALKEIFSTYSLKVPANSLWIGDIVKLQENGGFFEERTATLDVNYVVLDYENDPLTGSKRPIVYSRGAKQVQLPIQNVDNNILRNVSLIDLGTSPIERQSQAIYLKFVNPVTNFKIKININGKDLKVYPYGSNWDDNTPGYNLGSGLQKIDLQPFFSTLKSYNIKLYIKADNQIDLQGSTTLPYYALDANLITRYEIAYKDDLQELTGQEIVAKLQALTGDDRLGIEDLKNVEDTISGDYIATKLGEYGINLTKDGGGDKYLSDDGTYKTVSGGTGSVGTLNQVLAQGDDAQGQDIENIGQLSVQPTSGTSKWLLNTDDSGTFRVRNESNQVFFTASQDGKINQIPLTNTGDGSKVLTDDGTYKTMNSAGIPDNLEFKNHLAVKVLNRTGNTVQAGSFVFLASTNNQRFDIYLITKTTGYKGELIGYVRDAITNNSEGVAELITTIQTGETGITPLGEQSYIGFTSSLPDNHSVGISTEDKVEFIFGSCGVFGENNSIGESTTTFNAFEVQASYAVKDHNEKAIGYYIPPHSIDKENLMVYLNYTGTGSAGSVTQNLPEILTVKKGMQIFIQNKSASELLKLDIRPIGSDTIDGKANLEVQGGDQRVILIAGENNWNIIYNSLDHGDSAQVEANTKEIQRLKSDINEGSLPVFTYRGQTVPTFPDTKYKSYFITMYAMGSSINTITMPNPTDDLENGTIFSVDNNDRTNPLYLRPQTGGTINNKASTYKMTPDSVLFLVKNGTDWNVAYSGYMPRNLSTLIQAIQSKLNDQLHTIEEIQAQLKDRLHTFREIQTEFDDQLHTYNDIEAELYKRGYNKGMSCQWALEDTNSITGPTFTGQMIEPNQLITTNIGTGNKYIVFAVSEELNALIDGFKLNNSLEEFDSTPFEKDNRRFMLLISKNTIDISSQHTIYLNISLSGGSGSGIEIDDGTTNKAGIQKINVVNMKLSNIFDDSSEVTLTSEGGSKFLDGQTKVEFTPTKVQSLDKSIRIAQLQGNIADLSIGKSDYNSGIHVALGEDELINSKYGKSKLYFADTKVKGDSYVYPDLQTKSFVLQDIDPQDDPNVSGGTTFFVALYYTPDPNIENTVTQDGYIDLLLVDNDDNSIIGTDGQPMGVRLDYKSGDTLKDELYIGECQMKAYTEVHMKIHPVFPGEEIISVGSDTQICFQSITKDESSGLALLSFMAYTGFRFAFDTRYYGYNSLNLARMLVFDEPETEINNDTWELGQNLYLNSVSKLKISISGYHLILKDNGVDLPVFTLAKIYNELDSYYIKGKNYKVKATLVDKDDAFRVALMKYTGTTHPIPKPFTKSYNNENPVFESGWSIVDSLFISEDAVSGDHVATKTFTLPTDANIKSFAIIMYAVGSQIPMNLKLKDLEGDIEPWFNKTIITNNSHISEEHLLLSKEIYKFVVGNPGYASYRYTCSNVDTKVPIGIVKGGDGKITNNNAWTDVGAVDPQHVQGDFEFSADGKVQMEYSVRCFNEQSTVNQVQFWLAKNNGDGTFTEVPNSRTATTIEANRTKPKIVNSVGLNKTGKFTFDVTNGDSYRMFMKSDKVDGFYIQADTDGVPMYEAIITFDEVTAEEQDFLDRLSDLELHADEIQFIKDGKPVADPSKYKLQIDVDTGKTSIVTL